MPTHQRRPDADHPFAFRIAKREVRDLEVSRIGVDFGVDLEWQDRARDLAHAQIVEVPFDQSIVGDAQITHQALEIHVLAVDAFRAQQHPRREGLDASIFQHHVTIRERHLVTRDVDRVTNDSQIDIQCLGQLVALELDTSAGQFAVHLGQLVTPVVTNITGERSHALQRTGAHETIEQRRRRAQHDVPVD